jgi:hypothetical protein
MAFSLNLPRPWDSQGWKVKVRDRERLEPPHVTILHKTRSWRWGLRDEQFLDKQPDPKDVPEGILFAVRQNRDLLRRSWDRMYPENLIDSQSPTQIQTDVPKKRRTKPKAKPK